MNITQKYNAVSQSFWCKENYDFFINYYQNVSFLLQKRKKDSGNLHKKTYNHENHELQY